MTISSAPLSAIVPEVPVWVPSELGNERIQLQITASRLLQTVTLLKARGGAWTPP